MIAFLKATESVQSDNFLEYIYQVYIYVIMKNYDVIYCGFGDIVYHTNWLHIVQK